MASEAIGSSADPSQRRSGRTGGASLRPGAVGLAGLMFLVGCDSGQPQTPAPTTTQLPSVAGSATPAPFESVPPSASPQQAAVIAYRNMWTAFVSAGSTANPDDPNLARYATGNALTLIVNALSRNRDKHQVTKGDVLLDPKVIEFKPPHDPTEITISDCVNDENWLVYKDSGGLVDNVPGGKHQTTATVVRGTGGWQVNAFTLRDSGTC